MISNTQKFRNLILDRIEKDGVNLKEFNAEQQARIIKQYAATVYAESK